MHLLAGLFLALLATLPASAQIAPTEAELRAYGGLHAAAARGDVADIERRIARRDKDAVDAAIARRMSRSEARCRPRLVRLGDPNRRIDR